MTFKKRYIIILVLLIFIVFGIFTFAAPAGDESGKSGETVEAPNDTSSTDTGNNVVPLGNPTDENNNPNGNIEENAGGTAAGDDDAEAETADIDAIVTALVENLKKQTNDADSKAAIELAKEYRKNNGIVDKVAALNNDLELTLQEILDELSKVLDDSNGPEFNIEDGALLNSIASINVEDNEGNDIISLILIDEEGNEVEFTNDLKLTDGEYTLVATDAAYNESDVTFTFDTTAPSMKVGDVVYTPDHEGIIYSNTRFRAEAIDELSGVEKIYTNNKERTKIDVNGEGTYTFRLVDKVGNVAEYKVMVDKTAPSMKVGDVVYTPDHEETIYSKTRFTAEAIDKLSGIDKIYTNGKERTKIDVNGEGTYTFKLVDKAGNVAEYKVIVDKSSPLLTLNGDSEITLEGGIDEYVEKYATATDAIDGVTKNIAPVEIKWYKYDENAGGDHYVYQGIVDEVNTKVPGRYNVIYWTSDAAGNMSKKVTRIVFVQDTTAPTVNVNLDANGNKDIYVEAGEKYVEPGATVTDNVDETYVTGPSEIKYYDLAEKYDKEYTETLGTTVTTNKIGKYLLIYEVEDKAGNISDRNLLQAKRWVIVKDTIDPDVKVDVRTDKGVTDIVANDATELRFEIYRDGALKHSFDSNATSKRFSIDWLGDGTYTVVAIDRGGNRTSVEATINHTISSSEEFSEALETGGKFVLDEDITLSGEKSLSIASDKTVVLDLDNHTITNPVEAGAALENAGKLTITGNGSIVNGKSVRGSNTIVNLESGTLVIEGGSIGSETTAGNAVANYGTATINGGTFYSRQGSTKADTNTAYIFLNHKGVMTINNATVNTRTHGLFGAYGGNLVVNGGNYTLDGNGGLGCYIVYSNCVGIVTLNGGTINTNSPRNGNVFYAYVGGNLFNKAVVDAGYVVIKDAIIYKDGAIQTF